MSYPNLVVSIPLGTINTDRGVRDVTLYNVSIPLGTINTGKGTWECNPFVVSIPLGTINTCLLFRLLRYLQGFNSTRYN